MAEPHHPHRKPEDIGSDSPASEEAKEQGASGQRGGPRQAGERPRAQKQPPQNSGRRPTRHQPKGNRRKGFEPDERPSEQGEVKPTPERIASSSRQQGIKPRSGSHGAHQERTEEEARRGPPDGEHARRGRQHIPPKRGGSS